MNLVSFWILGAGGSGGGGKTGASGASRGGGAGGGSGGITRAVFPAWVLSDTIYILVGMGGAPVSATTAGNAGGTTYIHCFPDTSAVIENCFAKANGGGAGGAGSSGSASAGAAGAAVVQTSWCILGAMAIIWTSQAGAAGGTGGSGSGGAGNSVTAMSSIPITGGAGGGGVGATDTSVYSGGNVNTGGRFPQYSGGTGHSTSCHGQPGQNIWQPWSAIGGSGGGCNGDSNVNGGVGGNGGQAVGYGCGGGGGGGGITGGNGGAGGDGLVIINAW